MIMTKCRMSRRHPCTKNYDSPQRLERLLEAVNNLVKAPEKDGLTEEQKKKAAEQRCLFEGLQGVIMRRAEIVNALQLEKNSEVLSDSPADRKLRKLRALKRKDKNIKNSYIVEENENMGSFEEEPTAGEEAVPAKEACKRKKKKQTNKKTFAPRQSSVPREAQAALPDNLLTHSIEEKKTSATSFCDSSPSEDDSSEVWTTVCSRRSSGSVTSASSSSSSSSNKRKPALRLPKKVRTRKPKPREPSRNRQNGELNKTVPSEKPANQDNNQTGKPHNHGNIQKTTEMEGISCSKNSAISKNSPPVSKTTSSMAVPHSPSPNITAESLPAFSRPPRARKSAPAPDQYSDVVKMKSGENVQAAAPVVETETSKKKKIPSLIDVLIPEQQNKMLELHFPPFNAKGSRALPVARPTKQLVAKENSDADDKKPKTTSGSGSDEAKVPSPVEVVSQEQAPAHEENFSFSPADLSPVEDAKDQIKIDVKHEEQAPVHEERFPLIYLQKLLEELFPNDVDLHSFDIFSIIRNSGAYD